MAYIESKVTVTEEKIVHSGTQCDMCGKNFGGG